MLVTQKTFLNKLPPQTKPITSNQFPLSSPTKKYDLQCY